MQMSARCHRDAPGLKRKPFAAPYSHAVIFDRRTENSSGKRNFARGQRPLTANLALGRGWAFMAFNPERIP